MTEASRNEFIDRRRDEETNSGLATQVLYWYDQDKRKRKRTNGIAITMDGSLIVARTTCSRKDQFVRAGGRMKVSSRIFGRAKKHCWLLVTNTEGVSDLPAMFAKTYLDAFPGDGIGSKRAYNIGKVFVRYRMEIARRAEDMLDA